MVLEAQDHEHAVEQDQAADAQVKLWRVHDHAHLLNKRQLLEASFLFLIFIWMGGLFHWMTSWSSLGALGVFVAVVVLGITAFCIGGFVKRTELNQLVGKKREITMQVSRLESLLRHS